MIIDCHGHYTTAPAQLQHYRDAQIAQFEDPSLPVPRLEPVSDDEIRESIEQNQLKALRERGADLTIFSPKASAMAHHIGDEAVSKTWTRINNDLIPRVTQLFPENFFPVCQLPQSVGVSIRNSIECSHLRISISDPRIVAAAIASIFCWRVTRYPILFQP